MIDRDGVLRGELCVWMTEQCVQQRCDPVHWFSAVSHAMSCSCYFVSCQCLLSVLLRARRSRKSKLEWPACRNLRR